MQINTQKTELVHKETEEYNHELIRAEISIRKNILNTRKKRGFSELGKFGLTAVVIFILTFVGMNFSAFEKKASFFLSNLRENKNIVKIEEKTKPIVVKNSKKSAISISQEDSKKEELRRVEKIEVKKLELPPLLTEIAPPDNRLIIPRLKIHAPIKTAKNVNLNLANWENIEKQVQNALRNGVVNFPGTAQPGEKGNSFITGHSSYYPIFPGRYKSIFALLPEIEIGEKIEVWQNQRKFIYYVSEKKEVSPNTTDVLNDAGDSRLTLMTCTPLGTALRRLIVTAQLEEST